MDELEEYAEVARCMECESTWWHVEGCTRPDCACGHDVLGAVALDGLGRVISHHGQIVCMECGADAQLPQLAESGQPQQGLRLIPGEKE